MRWSWCQPRATRPSARCWSEVLAQARAREAAAIAEAALETVEAPPAAPPSATLRSLGLASDRACVESNLARKGLWRSGTSAGGELLRLLDATDQLGVVQRIDAGPPLGALAFDVIVWVCSRWRELASTDERQVPCTLEALAADLGWRKGGGAAAELAAVLDALRQATFRARVYNARIGETRIDTFGLLDRWERGEPCRSTRPARPGFVVLGDWLHEQLARKHVTFVSWAEMGRFGAPRHGGCWSTWTPSASRRPGGPGRLTSHCWRRSGSRRPGRTTSGPPSGARRPRSPRPRTATAWLTSNRAFSAASTGSSPSDGHRLRRPRRGGAGDAMDRGSRRDENGRSASGFGRCSRRDAAGASVRWSRALRAMQAGKVIR